MALRLTSGLGLALLAALAVDLGFGAAFVSDAVAYPICAYVGALAAGVIRRSDASVRVAWWVRVPLAAAVAVLVALGLRTIGLYQLPFGEGMRTSGHWPYFVLPCVVLAALGSVEGLIHWQTRRAARAQINVSRTA